MRERRVAGYSLDTQMARSVHPSDTSGMGQDAILRFDPGVMAPLAKPADEGVGYLTRKGPPILSIPIRKDLGKLGNTKMSEINETGRVVGGEAQGNTPSWIQHLHSLRGTCWAFPAT